MSIIPVTMNYRLYQHTFTSLPVSDIPMVLLKKTRIGNHIGSIDLGLEYEFDKTRLLIYRQNFYEGGALSQLANIQDGLNGISITNKIDQDKSLSGS